MVIDLRTSRTALRGAFKAAHGALPGTIDSSLTAAEVKQLVTAHRGARYASALAALAATHPNADDALFRFLLGQGDSVDDGVASAIATSGRAGPTILRAIARKAGPGAREHAELALIAGTLDREKGRYFAQLLARHSDDTGISLGVRHLLAHHRRTPKAVLERLATDEVDAIASAARSRLRRRTRS